MNHPPRLPIPRRLTEVEAAARLALSPRTLQRWRVMGGGPPFLKLGASVRYDAEALEQWAAAQTRGSTADPGARPKPRRVYQTLETDALPD